MKDCGESEKDCTQQDDENEPCQAHCPHDWDDGICLNCEKEFWE